jgi:opacity protein-like surface antigen
MPRTELKSWFRPALRSCLLATVLQLIHPIRARAENRVDYRYEDYIEDNDRIRIRTHSVYAEQQLNSKVTAKGNFIYDGISGATPTGGIPSPGSTQVPLQQFEDIRRAGYLEGAITTGRFITRPQVSYSVESDYESIGISLNESIEFNQKNTIVTFGVARNFDRVTGFWLSNKTIWKDKDTWDALIGVTQLLGPKTYLTANFTVSVADGYLTDPYKGVYFRFDYPGDDLNTDPSFPIPERRPDQRVKEVAYLGITHFVSRLKGSIDASYRLHHDDWGILAHTFTATWNQKIGNRLTVSPIVRYHLQSAADFYAPVFSGSNNPGDQNGVNVALQSDGSYLFDGDAGYPGDGTPFAIPAWPKNFSSDYRLSHMETFTAGVGVRWDVTDHISVDLAYKRYVMRGLDSVSYSSSYPEAHVFTVGMGFRW